MITVSAVAAQTGHGGQQDFPLPPSRAQRLAEASEEDLQDIATTSLRTVPVLIPPEQRGEASSAGLRPQDAQEAASSPGHYPPHHVFPAGMHRAQDSAAYMQAPRHTNNCQGGPAQAEELSLQDDQIEKLVRKVFTHDLIGDDPQWARYFTLPLSSSTGGEDESASKPSKQLTCKERFMAFRLKVWYLFSHPDSSTAAYAVSMFMITIILLNTATFCIETVPMYERSPLAHQLNFVDYVCLGIFTLEFLVRICSCPSLKDFLKSPMNWIDFASVFPFYVEMMVVGINGSGASQARILRLIRLLRVLRLLKLASRFQNLQVVLDALVASMDVLGMLAFLLLILLVVFSTVLFYIEGPEQKDGWNSWNSIPAVMWFTQVTLTTTGYGDMYPITNWGKFVAGITMLCCMVTVALPISVVGGNFSTMWTEYKQIKDAADRSKKVWSNFTTLKESLVKHQAVLEDVLHAVKGAQAAVDKDVAFLREQLSAARLAYTQRMEMGKSAGWAEDMYRLQASCAAMKDQLAAARDRWDGLVALMGLATMAQADDFVAKLDRLHAGNKALRKWSEEGMYMVEDVQTLAADLQALKAFLGVDMALSVQVNRQSSG